jgi:thiamine biosynthesis lipoprotein
MKRFSLLMIALGLITSLAACQTKNEMQEINYYDYMYTFISVRFYGTEAEKKVYQEEIGSIYAMYHELSTSYEPLTSNSNYLTNVYEINQAPNVKHEIDQALYDMLEKAQLYETMTSGHFNITLGKVVDSWKSAITFDTYLYGVGDRIYIHQAEGNLIQDTGTIVALDEETIEIQFANEVIRFDRTGFYAEKQISQEVFESTVRAVEAINVTTHEVVLETQNDRYYVTIKGDQVKLDLGAFSKGYATEKAKEYLMDQGLEYFSISAGSSSIVVGKNQLRPELDEVFIVSLKDPMNTYQAISARYGLIHIKETSLATSGNFEQYAMYEGLRYHHIVSPFTKQPTHSFQTITISGNDAGLLDALSTALFVMTKEEVLSFLAQYQSEFDLEVILYLYDGTIESYLNGMYFEVSS